MSDETASLLELIGTARVTFDRRRNWTLPCYFCDKSDEPRTLVTIGRYGNGDDITRPVCPKCRPHADRLAGTT